MVDLKIPNQKMTGLKKLNKHFIMDKRSYYQQVFIVIGEAKSNLSISDYEELLQDVESSVNSQLGELLSMDTEEYDEDLDLGEEDEDTDLDVFDTPEQEEYDDREDDTRYDGITATDIGKVISLTMPDGTLVNQKVHRLAVEIIGGQPTFILMLAGSRKLEVEVSYFTENATIEGL
jgi:hypothetical protein